MQYQVNNTNTRSHLVTVIYASYAYKIKHNSLSGCLSKMGFCIHGIAYVVLDNHASLTYCTVYIRIVYKLPGRVSALLTCKL